MGYLTITEIDNEITRLAGMFSDLCQRLTFTIPTHDGQTMSYLKVGRGGGASRPRVLVTGGVHAREWVSPNALLLYLQAIFTAYRSGAAVSVDPFTTTVAAGVAQPASYPAFTLPNTEVRRIIDNLDLFVVPVVNWDGYAFTMLANDLPHREWRKNRRPKPDPADPNPDCSGVDLNRNYEIAWNINEYYNTATVAAVPSALSEYDNPCHHDLYHGPNPGSEPETRNIMALVTSQNIQFSLDIHSFGRLLLYPWVIEDSQSAAPDMNFNNADWHRPGVHAGRDGIGGTYGEFFPDNSPFRLNTTHNLIASRMKQAILNSAGADPDAVSTSQYTVDHGSALVGLSPGSMMDWIFSRHLATPPVYTFAMECGFADEGRFQPDFVLVFPKIKREVFAALHAYLSYIAAWNPPRTSSSTCPCFIATAVFGSPYHPHVEFLRDLRDRVFPSTRFGAHFIRAIERVYYSFSPTLARHLAQHEGARRLTRAAFLSPLVALLRIAARSASRVGNPEGQVAVLAGAVTMMFFTLLLAAGVLLTLIFRLFTSF